MKRQNSSILITALVLASGVAFAQPQADAPRRSVQLAERMSEMKGSLSKAITAAESHSNGVAIGIRLSMEQDPFLGEGMSLRTSQPRDAQPARTPDTRDAGQDRSRQPTGQTPPQTPGSEVPLYAIVTCVVENTKVREVVIDMRNNTALGMRSSSSMSYGNDRDADDRQWNLARASDLMNASARSRSGDKLGDIDELAIDPTTDRVVYAVLRRGGFLGINESRYAIPTAAMTTLNDGRITINLAESDFKDRQGFSNSSWPNRADPQLTSALRHQTDLDSQESDGRSWSRDDRQEAETRAPGASADAPVQILKASTIIGREVQCREQQKLGKIRDLVLNPSTGRIVYAVIQTPQGEIAVPMSVLQARGNIYSMPMTQAQVRAVPVLNADREPNWNDARWNHQNHEVYGTQVDASDEASHRRGVR